MKQITVLIATVASCWSINCRSFLTIIMDTQQFNGKESNDYDLIDIVQMIGLTGRPLVDNFCQSVVMCHFSKAAHYGRALSEQIQAESQLPANLIDHVNYEISAGSITELNNIYKPYMAHTYFYKRISINPNYYGVVVPEDSDQKARVFANFFNNIVNNVAKELRDREFMTMDGSVDNPTFSPGLLAKISLEYYLSFGTLVNYARWLSTNAKTLQLRPLELIELISTNTVEFNRIQVKYGEMHDLKYLQRRHRPNEVDQLNFNHFKIKLLILSQYQKNNGREDEVYGELIEDRRFIITLAYRLLMAIVDIAWLKDSYHLAKTAIQLTKKLSPFYRTTKPNIDMDINIVKTGDLVKIDVSIIREDEPFSLDEFRTSSSNLPLSMYRDEGWCFLINGRSRLKRDDPEKFILFKRVKTPNIGKNEYKLEFELTDNSETYSYDLYFMSDFYSTSEDRRVDGIDISSI